MDEVQGGAQPTPAASHPRVSTAVMDMRLVSSIHGDHRYEGAVLQQRYEIVGHAGQCHPHRLRQDDAAQGQGLASFPG